MSDDKDLDRQHGLKMMMMSAKSESDYIGTIMGSQ